jgi:hypothetical protein
MDYRGDREALMSKLSSVEGELEVLRKEADELRGAAERNRALEAELAAAKKEIARLSGKRLPKKPMTLVQLIIGTAAIGVCASGLISFVARGARPPPAPPPPPIPQELPVAIPPSNRPSVPLVRPVVATWSASVVIATGLPLRKGTPCTVVASMTKSEHQSRTWYEIGDVTIDCSGTRVYSASETQKLDGMSQRGTSIDPHPDGFGLDISFSDMGQQSLGPTANINTAKSIAVVTKTTSPPYRVELSVAKAPPQVVVGDPK